MIRRLRKRVRHGGLFVALVFAPVVLVAPVGATNASDAATPLEIRPSSVGNSAEFSLSFTTPQYCPGDSDSGYLWQTFIIPAGSDPSSLTFSTGLPEGPDFTSALRDASGSWIRNNNPGLTDGLVVPPRSVSFSGSAFEKMKDGSYLLGLACTKQGADNVTRTVRSWATPITVSRTGTGSRSRLNVEAQVPAAESPISPTPVPPIDSVAESSTSLLPGTSDEEFVGSSSEEFQSAEIAVSDAGVSSKGPTASKSGAGWQVLVWAVVAAVFLRSAYLVATRRSKRFQ